MVIAPHAACAAGHAPTSPAAPAQGREGVSAGSEPSPEDEIWVKVATTHITAMEEICAEQASQEH